MLGIILGLQLKLTGLKLRSACVLCVIILVYLSLFISFYLFMYLFTYSNLLYSCIKILHT